MNKTELEAALTWLRTFNNNHSNTILALLLESEKNIVKKTYTPISERFCYNCCFYKRSLNNDNCKGCCTKYERPNWEPRT